MRIPTPEFAKQLGGLLFFAAVFLGVSYLAQAHRADLAAVVHEGGVYGVVGFILLTTLFVVFIIPLDLVFLVPLGSAVWGPVPTALMSISGWTLGAAIAFGIARRFGQRVVGVLVGLERVRAIEARIPTSNLFWTVVFLRLLVSVDVLSYALGLFSRMRWGEYILATALGVCPFGFYFAYAGVLPFWYRLGAVALALLVTALIVWRYRIPREP